MVIDMTRSILIVDDDARIRASLSEALIADNWSVSVADSGEAGLNAVAEDRPDVVLADIRMPGMNGIELLRRLRSRSQDVDVLLMTAFNDLPTVAVAMRDGAADFLVKPIGLRRLRRVLERVVEDREARRRVRSGTRKQQSLRSPRRSLVGADPRMVEIFKLVGQVAANRTNVVIRGESGTGKELIARAIHAASPFSAEPFVAVNCTALPAGLLESELFGHVRGAFTGATSDRKGRFEMAGRGSLFLDEIGDTPVELQAKLLRVLQEHEYFPVGGDRAKRTEARVIAATHRNLEERVESGSFRADLYYRLRVIEIRVPPLRERLNDLPLLAEHLIRKVADATAKPGLVLAPESMRILMMHDWPGNVRELENCLTRAAVAASGSVIRPEHFDLGSEDEEPPHVATLDEAEREHLARVLEVTSAKKALAARLLEISRPRLDRLIERHQLGDLVDRLRRERRSTTD
jgi:two-component system response regulator AtoC